MSTRFSLCCWVVLGLLATGCNDVFEEDISEQEVTLFAPSEGYVTALNAVELVWNDVPDAFQFQIQVAEPDFIGPDVLHVDSTLQGTSYSATLQAGRYAWRVRGVNAESETAWTERSFVIAPDGTLTGNTPSLESPTEGAYVANGEVSFAWQPLTGADFYLVGLYADDNGVPATAYTEQHVVEDASLTASLSEGDWWWRVRAYSDGGSASDFSQQALTVDLTAPTDPQLDAPLDGAEVSGLTTFSWTYGADLHPAVDSVWVASDPEFSTLLYTLETAESSTELDLSTWNAGMYYWRVVTYDLAGNASNPSTLTFTIP